MHTIFVFIFILFSVSAKEEGVSNVFEKLGFLNEQWLKKTSFPESAILLKHPPYRYHTKLSNKEESYGSNKNGPTENDGKRCADDIIQIVTHIGSDWALQMLDSDGKLESGILKGGIIWPGHFGECASAYAPSDGNGHGDFHGQYCITSWKMNVSKQYSNLPLTVGFCVPDSCSASYLNDLGQDLLHTLDRTPLKNIASHITLNSVSCKKKEKTLDTASKIYLSFIGIFVSLSIVGTLVTLYNKYKVSKESQRKESITATAAESNIKSVDKESVDINAKKHYLPRRISLEKETTDSDKAVLTSNEQATPKFSAHENKQVDSVFVRICRCFSLIDNGEKILNTTTSGDQLMSIHGIRFLSLTWVILGHTYISSISIIGNRIDVLKEMDSFPFQMLLQAPFSVDSFFLLSGFLLAYLYLRDADKTSGKTNWIYFYVHRFWRLTPAYMVVVFFYLFVFKYFGSGPFWEDDHCDASRSSWWKYLIYINNFIPINQMCIGWSWYLANDMQFYVISPLFLYPLWRWPIAGFSLLFSMLLGTWVTTAVLSYHFDLIPMFVGVTQTSDFNAYATKMWDSFDLIYDKPYTRIAPYLIGIALGYILHRLNKRKNFLTWWQQLIGWMSAAFFGLSVVFGLYHVSMSKTTALFYNSMCRSSFSLCLAWLIFACETGHGGFINKLLTWKFWTPLSRLTYCAYLVHPIFIHAYYQAYQTEFFFTEYTIITNFFGFLVISYCAAFLFSILFESPLMNLEKLLLSKVKKRV